MNSLPADIGHVQYVPNSGLILTGYCGHTKHMFASMVKVTCRERAMATNANVSDAGPADHQWLVKKAQYVKQNMALFCQQITHSSWVNYIFKDIDKQI